MTAGDAYLYRKEKSPNGEKKPFRGFFCGVEKQEKKKLHI